MNKKKKIFFLIPLIVSVIWLVYLIVLNKNPIESTLLSPSFIGNLIKSLGAFILIYSIAIGIIFKNTK